VCDCAESGAEGEEDDGRDEQPLATEARGGRRDHGLADSRREEVRCACPERLSG